MFQAHETESNLSSRKKTRQN